MPHDVFQHHDGIVNDKAYGECERHQRQIVDAEVEQRHDRERADDRHWQCQTWNHRRDEVAQEHLAQIDPTLRVAAQNLDLQRAAMVRRERGGHVAIVVEKSTCRLREVGSAAGAKEGYVESAGLAEKITQGWRQAGG